MARPSKLTTQTTQRISDALTAGNTRTAAAAYAGISDQLQFLWLAAGRKAAALVPDGEEASDYLTPDQLGFLQFFHALTRSEATAEVRMVATIMQAAIGQDVQKVATKTRKYPQMVKPLYGAGPLVPVEVTETTTTVTSWHKFDWRAAAFWLERRRPEDWGRFTLDSSKLTPETLAELVGFFTSSYL